MMKVDNFNKKEKLFNKYQEEKCFFSKIKDTGVPYEIISRINNEINYDMDSICDLDKNLFSKLLDKSFIGSIDFANGVNNLESNFFIVHMICKSILNSDDIDNWPKMGSSKFDLVENKENPLYPHNTTQFKNYNDTDHSIQWNQVVSNSFSNGSVFDIAKNNYFNKIYLLKENDETNKHVEDFACNVKMNNIPVLNGPSGVALRFLNMYRNLIDESSNNSLPSMEDARLACLTFLITNDIHTYHEAMISTSGIKSSHEKLEYIPFDSYVKKYDIFN